MGLNFLIVGDKAIKRLIFLILMGAFLNQPNELHIISGFKNIASPRSHAVSFVCK